MSEGEVDGEVEGGPPCLVIHALVARRMLGKNIFMFKAAMNCFVDVAAVQTISDLLSLNEIWKIGTFPLQLRWNDVSKMNTHQLPWAMATTSVPLMPGRHAARNTAIGLCQGEDSGRSQSNILASIGICSLTPSCPYFMS